jgi:SAM-dependent methyltransferase
MPDIQSTDYHDFVFRDGKLVGEFEQMYQKSREVPWLQQDDPLRLDCRIASDFLIAHGPFDTVMEVGCGLGYFAQFLYQRLGPSQLDGVDVSPTAIERAKRMFPLLRFDVLDITQPLPEETWGTRNFGLVVVRGCLWYLYQSLDVVIDNLHQLTAPEGAIFVAQNFPPLESSFVGKDVLPNPAILIKHIERRFEVEMTCELKDLRPDRKNDHWIMIFGRRKK